MKIDGYIKHTLSFLCPECIYYKFKEMITGMNYDLDDSQYGEEVNNG